MSESEPILYGAFISYRHVEPDRAWAKWLHTTLETFRTPKRLVEQGVPERVGRVFRDEEELPASPALTDSIDKALQASRYLIVICSPRTPESRWVDAEVSRFRELERHDRILALLVDGDPASSFPPALCEIRQTSIDAEGNVHESVEAVEPLAADVRPKRQESARHLKRMAKLRLLACLLGCTFDDLRWREQERRQRFVKRAAIVLTLLVAVLAGLTIEAVRQRSRAETREQDVRRLFAGHLRETGREAWLRGDLRRAYDDLTKAYAAGETGWSTRFLVARVRETAETLVFEASATGMVPPSARCIAVDPDGRFAATAEPTDEETTIRLLSIPDGRVLLERTTDDQEVRTDVARGGERVAVAGSRFELWNPSAAQPLLVVQARAWDTRFSPNGKSIAVLEQRSVWIADAATGQRTGTHILQRPQPKRLRWIDDKHLAVAHESGGVTLVGGARDRIVPDASGFETAGDGRIALWDTKGRFQIRNAKGAVLAAGSVGSEPIAAALAPGREAFAIRPDSGPFRLFLEYPGDSFARRVVPEADPASDPLAFSGSGALLATFDPEGSLHVVNAFTGQVLGEFVHRRRFLVAEAGFATAPGEARERHLWVVSWEAGYKRRTDEGRTLRVWRLPPRRMGRLPDALGTDIADQLARHHARSRADHAAACPAVTLTPQESDSGELATWVSCGKRSWTVPGGVGSACASPDGRLVATIARGLDGAGGTGFELVVWDAATGRALRRTNDVEPFYEVHGFAGDARTLLVRQFHGGTSARYPLAGYDVATLKERWTLSPGVGEARLPLARDPARTRAVTTVETHKDLRVATALVDLATGATRELDPRAADDVAWHPSGNAVAALFGREVRVWDATDGLLLLRDPAQEKQARIEGKTGPDDETEPDEQPLRWIRFDQTGEWLAWCVDGLRTWRRVGTVAEAEDGDADAIRRRAAKFLRESPDYP